MIDVADYSDRMHARLIALSAALAMTAMAATPSAQAPALREPQGGARKIGDLLDTLDKVRGFHETAISPDGRFVAWVEDVSAADGTTAIYLRRIGAPVNETRAILASNDGRGHKDDGLAWSPDGQTLAFFSDAGPTAGQQQIYVINVNDNQPAFRVTSVKGQLAQPKWSPDSKQLAVLFVAGSTQSTGALVAYKPDAGVVGGVVEEQRIAIVEQRAVARGQPGEHVRLRLRLVARRQGVRRRSGRGIRHQQLLDRAALRGPGRQRQDDVDLEAAAADRRAALVARREVDRGDSRDHERRRPDRRRHLRRPRGRRRGEERHAEPRRIRARARLAAGRPHPVSGVRGRQVGARHRRPHPAARAPPSGRRRSRW